MATMRGIVCGAALAVAALCGMERAARGVVIYDNLMGSNNGAIPVTQTTYVGVRFNTDATNLSITGATLLLQSTTPGVSWGRM